MSEGIRNILFIEDKIVSVPCEKYLFTSSTTMNSVDNGCFPLRIIYYFVYTHIFMYFFILYYLAIRWFGLCHRRKQFPKSSFNFPQHI